MPSGSCSGLKSGHAEPAIGPCSKMKQYLSWNTFAATGGLFCLMAVLAFIGQILTLNQQKNLEPLQEYVWAIEELRVEYYQTLYVTGRVSEGLDVRFPQAALFDDPTRGLLHLRMDVLASRVARLSDDVILAQLADYPPYLAIVGRVEEQFAQISSELQGADQLDTQAHARLMQDKLRPLEPSLDQLSVDLVRRMNLIDAGRRQSLEQTISISQVALTVLFVFLVLTLYISTRLSARERQRSTQLEQLNEELATANRSKERFVAHMSHEFRTPLNAIIGFSELMQETKSEGENAGKDDFTDEVLKSAYHLLELVNEVLNFSQLSGTDQILDLESVELTGIIRNSSRLVQAAYPKRNIEFDAPEDGSHVHAMGHDRAIRQIVQNLLTNAAKYAGEEARIRVEIVGWKTSTVAVRISDDGNGMDAATLERVLRPFERNTSQGKSFEQIEGVGLGFAICRLLAKQLDTRLEFDTAPGCGFTAELWLQRADGTGPP